MAIFPGSAIPSAVSAYDIDNSLRFDDGDAAYLSRTMSTPTNNKKWTFSWWFKRGNFPQSQFLSANGGQVYMKSTDQLSFYSGAEKMLTTQLFRDPSAWYHCVFSMDTTQAAFADQMKLYVNGSQVTAFDTSAAVTQDSASLINSAVAHYIGRYDGSGSEYWDGYLAEVYFIDGTVLDADDFGELSSTTNQWKPLDSDDVKDAVTFGTNGFFQKYNSTELANSFTDSSAGLDTFTTAESTTWTAPTGVTSVDYLVVAGGGGGGGDMGGGGGAGGFRTGTLSVTAGNSYTVTVGAGGAGSSGDASGNGANGSDSVFSSITSTGGGGGWGNDGATTHDAGDGGSGGGASLGITDIGEGNTPSTDPSQGNDGGDGYSDNGGGSGGGGGGGAAAVGGTAVEGNAGAGGAGTLSTIDGYYYAGGGGGLYERASGTENAGNGGIGGGGGGSAHTGGTAGTGGGSARNTGGNGNVGSATTAGAGGANTGGGGGGSTNNGTGGAGGSGIVIITYRPGTGFHTITANGDATNQRPQHHDVTANGAAHLIGPKVGTSVISMDGTGDSIYAASSSDFNFGTGDFTLEAWINNNGSGNEAIFAHFTSGTDKWYFIADYSNDSLAIYDRVSGLDAESKQGGSNGASITNGAWHHVAAVRSSGVVKFYIDGKGQDNQATPTLPAANFGKTATCYIGEDGQGSDYWNGYFGPLRISNSARYTADFDIPTTVWTNDGNTKLLIQNGTDGSQTFDDLSTPDHTITANGDVRWFAPKVGAGAMAFPGYSGADGYYEVTDSQSLDINGNSDWTVEFWLRRTSTDSASDAIINHALDGGHGWNINWDGSDKVRIYNGNDGSGGVTASTAITAHTWTHVAFEYIASSTVLTVYLDGTSDNTSTGQVSWTNINDTLWIGAQDTGSGATRFFSGGWIDGLRISRKARYSGSFTPSTTAFTDDINSALILNAGYSDGTYNPDTSTGLAISEKSRMDFDGTGDYLSVPDSSDWDFTASEATIECWLYLNTMPGVSVQLIGQNDGAASNWFLYLYANGTIAVGIKNVNEVASASGVISTGTWYHVAAVREGSGGTAVTRVYVDGVSVANATAQYFNNSSDDLFIGGHSTESGLTYMDGYLDEIRISNTERYDATFTPQTRGNPFVADANTKLLIHSDYTGGLGADSSGNYNNFAATNLVATDQMIDTPTNNFGTMNPLDEWQSPAFSEGNLKISSVTGGEYEQTKGTIGQSSGKYYFETRMGGTGGAGTHTFIGVMTGPAPITSWFGGDAGHWSYGSEGKIVHGGSATDTTPASYTDGDIIGCAVDLDNGELYWSKDNTWITNSGGTCNPVTRANPCYSDLSGTILPAFAVYESSTNLILNTGSDSSFAGNETAQGNQDANGKGDFYYTPPTDFLALCTDNLSDPEIALPGENFNTVLYTGNATIRNITGVGFQPDFTWIKGRSHADTPALFDTTRGATNLLKSSETQVQQTDANTLTGWVSDGFSLGTDSGHYGVNVDTETIVSWNWKAGGAPTADNSAGAGATPTAGSVKIDGSNLGSALAGTIAAKRLSANTTSGFSIVEWTGTGTASTVAHGLSTAPTMVIVKNFDGAVAAANEWAVYSEPVGNTKALYLDNNLTPGTSINFWNNTTPTASVFSVYQSTTTNENAEFYVAYCFSNIEGYSKVGSYIGNGATGTAGSRDGPFVYTSFTPAFTLIKRTDSADNWFMYDDVRDTYNYVRKEVLADLPDAEGVNPYADYLSNGFKLRGGANVDGGTYIYLAFAESPFKTSNAR
jgi:hypothetical protein